MAVAKSDERVLVSKSRAQREWRPGGPACASEFAGTSATIPGYSRGWLRRSVAQRRLLSTGMGIQFEETKCIQ